MNIKDRYADVLKQYPKYISKEQMRLICHISKRKARHLLLSGLVPCENSGKLTRNYKIKTADVVKYLREREVMPEKYIFEPIVYTVPDPDDYMACMRVFYDELFIGYPDVVRVNDAAEMTGYSDTTIKRWLQAKRFKAFRRYSAYFIPKITLIDFIVSPYYRSMKNKSEKQKNDMRAFDNSYWESKKGCATNE